MRTIFVRMAAVAGLCAGIVAMPVRPVAAQDNRQAARDVVKKWQEAIVNVRVVLKTRMSMGGREMQASDDPVDTVGTVIDSSGLTVLSLGSLNPGAMMSKLMGSAGGSGQPAVEITTEPTEVKIRLSNGRELPARIVLRDEDLDLAFLRPTTKPETPLERPRTFYVLAGASSGMGTPAFLTNGRVVGLLTLRQIEAGRASMASMMGGTESMGMLGVILPAADVLEIAKQAPEK